MDILKLFTGMFKNYMPTDIDWVDEQKFDANGMPIPFSDNQVVAEVIPKYMDSIYKVEDMKGMLTPENTQRLRPEQKETQSIEAAPSEKPGYMMAEGSNFWSVNTDDPYWDTEQGYQEAVNLYGTSPAWSSRPMEQENQFVSFEPSQRMSL